MQEPKLGRRHQPLAAAVLASLRDAIVAGIYSPGQRLVEEDLALELEVSRGPIREALHLLAIEGFVEIEPRRGAKVAIFTRKQADDLFVMRLTLEGLVARLAAERRTDDQLRTLLEVCEQGRSAANAQRTEDLPSLNTAFHEALADAADNTLLAEQLSTMSTMIQWAYAKRIRERLGDSWNEHRAIVDAVAARDAVAAEAAAQRHVQNAWVAYVGD